MDNAKIISAYKKMFQIRQFETSLLDLFNRGLVTGTTHTYSGQEAIAVSIMESLGVKDTVFSNHRCHGHYLAYSDDVEGLFYEIIGDKRGVNQGYGGSQHIQNGNFFSNGIQGGYMPIVVGMAMASKLKKEEGIVVAFIGDGTWGEGVVYESMNIASLFKVPLLVVVENNFIAQTTSIELNTAGKLIDRAKAFDLSCGEISSSDVKILIPLFQKLISKVRKDQKAHIQIVNTSRFNGHSKGDDTRDFNYVNKLKINEDPIQKLKLDISEKDRVQIEKDVKLRIEKLINTIT